MRSQVKDGHLKAGHETAFKPQINNKERNYKIPYEHMSDFKEVKKNFRDEDGAVVVGPRNFLTNPAKQGKIAKNTTFERFPEHLPENYNIQKEIATKELAYHHSKLQEKPFSSLAKKTHLFNNDKAVRGEDVPIPARAAKSPPKPPMEHEVAFKPSSLPRSGAVKMTINRFPAYMENPLKSVTRKMPVEGEEPPPAFKSPTKMMKTRPSPSITMNVRNLKASFPSAFRR